MPAPSNDPNDASAPLSGIRVLDFSHVYQGPVGTQLLADYGADVIKLERPGSGDWSRAWGPFVEGVSLPFANLNRNKRSITVDIKSDEGKDIVRKLVGSADVLVHNFRSGVMEKLGFGYEAMHALNPRLVYAASSGWGDKGPYADRKRGGHDMMARAEAGWFVDQGPGKAPIPGGISADYPSGLMLMLGILMALQHRERSGEGQLVTTDLLSVAFHAHAWEGATELNADRIDAPARVGGTEAAVNKAFLTADGAIEISPVFSDNALRDISEGLGIEDLSKRPEFATESLQIENSDALNELLAKEFLKDTTENWIARLEAAGVFCAHVNSFTEAAADPQIAANEMVVDVPHGQDGTLKALGTPVRLYGAPRRPHRAPPRLGANSAEILAELGLPKAEIESLLERGIVGEPTSESKND